MQKKDLNKLEIKLNVIMIGRFPYPNGMAGTKRVRYFAEHLYAKGCDVKIITLMQPSLRGCCGEHNGIYYESIGEGISENRINIIKYVKYILCSLFILKHNKSKDRKNIIYLYGPPELDNFFIIVASRIIGYKVVFDIVEDYKFSSPNKSIKRTIRNKFILIFEKKINLLADGIIVISRHLYDKFTGIVDSYKVKIRIITISANIINKKFIKKKLITLLYSGSFAEKDGVFNLIEAFERVAANKSGLELLLTGRGDKSDIDSMTNRIKGKINIKYLGYLNECKFLNTLNSADILCATRIDTNFSRAGVPFKLGEYLATGKPVIVSNIGDVSCYLEHKKDAMLVEPGNIQDIELAIKYLINNPKEARCIGINGREKCALHFDPVCNGNLLLQLLREI